MNTKSNTIHHMLTTTPSRIPTASVPCAKDDRSIPVAITSNTVIEDDRKRGREEDVTAGDILEERRAKNRISAHNSRLRKLRQVDTLERQLLRAEEEAAKLKAADEVIRTQLTAARAENRQLRLMHPEVMRIITTFRLAQGGMHTAAGMLSPSLR